MCLHIPKIHGGGYWSTKQKYGLIGKKLILGVASIWDSRKGLEYFLKIYEKLSDNSQIVLVGLTHEQITQLPNRIIGINRTNSISELRELYGIADVFVNPTLEDNYPTTNLEAISCGTPVITFDTGGSPESAEKFGVKVDKGNISNMISVIDKMMLRKDYYDFSAQHMIEKYLDVLEGEQN